MERLGEATGAGAGDCDVRHHIQDPMVVARPIAAVRAPVGAYLRCRARPAHNANGIRPQRDQAVLGAEQGVVTTALHVLAMPCACCRKV